MGLNLKTPCHHVFPLRPIEYCQALCLATEELVWFREQGHKRGQAQWSHVYHGSSYESHWFLYVFVGKAIVNLVNHYKFMVYTTPLFGHFMENWEWFTVALVTLVFSWLRSPTWDKPNVIYRVWIWTNPKNGDSMVDSCSMFNTLNLSKWDYTPYKWL